MKWHRFRFSKTLWIGLLILSNSSLASLSFKEAIDLAFQNNEDVLIQKERIQKAHYTHKKAQGAHYPTLTGSSSLRRSRAETSITETYSTTKTYGVTLATDIYSGNATNLAVKQAIIKKRQGRTSLKQIKLGLLRKLRESFARALYAQKYVKLSRRILKRKRDNYDFFRLRYPGGLEPLWAFKQAKTEYKEAKWELKEAEKDKELTLKTLYLHIGLPFPEKNRLSLKGSFKLFKLPSLKDLKGRVSQKHLDLKYQNQDIDWKNKAIGIKKAGFLPTLGMSSSYSISQTDSGDETKTLSGSLNLSWNIFSGLQTSNAVKEARADLIITKRTLKKIKRARLDNLERAYRLHSKARNRTTFTLLKFKAARERAMVVQQEYSAGLQSYLSWESSQNNWTQKEIVHLQALRDTWTTLAQLEEAVGSFGQGGKEVFDEP